jgi:hypothetical protein
MDGGTEMVNAHDTAAELRIALTELLLRLPEKDRRDLLRDAQDRQAQQKTTEGA